MNIDTVRKRHLMIAEWLDAWRIIPRVVVGGYAYLLYKTIVWYMHLRPYIMDGCVSTNITDCVVQAPSTQHAALITAIVGMGAAIFAFYANTGRKWDSQIVSWNTEKDTTDSTSE